MRQDALNRDLNPSRAREAPLLGHPWATPVHQDEEALVVAHRSERVGDLPERHESRAHHELANSLLNIVGRQPYFTQAGDLAASKLSAPRGSERESPASNELEHRIVWTGEVHRFGVPDASDMKSLFAERIAKKQGALAQPATGRVESLVRNIESEVHGAGVRRARHDVDVGPTDMNGRAGRRKLKDIAIKRQAGIYIGGRQGQSGDAHGGPASVGNPH